MRILLKFFLSLILCCQILHAKEPFLAILNSVEANDIQTFQYTQWRFVCMPYGVISLDEIHRNATEKSECKKSIEKFYVQNNEMQFFTASTLHIKQMYPLSCKERNRCIIKVNGEKSLSERLLEEGMAVLDPAFKDEEYEYYFHSAQKKAKFERKGLWQGNILKQCSQYIRPGEDD